MQLTRRTTLACIAATLAGCGSARQPISGEEIGKLAAALRDHGIRRDDADNAAELSFRHTEVLARKYEIVDPPLVHNTKVNLGLKPRGLCWHWAEDMEARLKAERFETLDLHRAIANAENPYRIDHSTVVASAKDSPMEAGIVLDPWRLGGRLFWAPVVEDVRYNWLRQRDAHDIIRRRKLAEMGIHVDPGE